MGKEVQKNDIAECVAESSLLKKGVIGRICEIDGNLALFKVAGNEAIIWVPRWNLRRIGLCQSTERG